MLLQPSTPADPAARLGGVIRAFRRLAARRPCLEIGICGTVTAAGEAVDPDRGVDIRLGCPNTGSVAVLRLMPSGAVLRAVSAARPESGMVSVVEDQLSLYLDRGFRWGSRAFATPDELARALLGHMTRRLAVVADGSPAWTSRAVPATTPVPAWSGWPRALRSRPVLSVRHAPGVGTGRL